jgi:hypothetical protein
MKRRYIALLICVVVAVTALEVGRKKLAAQVPVTGWDYEYVGKVNVEGNHLGINVMGNFIKEKHSNCEQPYWAFSPYPLSDERTKAMLSVALASFLGRRRVWVETQGCDARGYPVLYAVSVHEQGQ